MLVYFNNQSDFDTWLALANAHFGLPNSTTTTYTTGSVHPQTGQVGCAITEDLPSELHTYAGTISTSLYFWLHGEEPDAR